MEMKIFSNRLILFLVLFSAAYQFQPEYTDEQLHADILKLHNDYRSKHGCEPLLISNVVRNYKLYWIVFILAYMEYWFLLYNFDNNAF